MPVFPVLVGKIMEREEIVKITEEQVNEYLQQAGDSQAAIQEARQQIKWYRLGRMACTPAEEVLVVTVHAADKLLRKELSAKLGENPVRNRRGNK